MKSNKTTLFLLSLLTFSSCAKESAGFIDTNNNQEVNETNNNNSQKDDTQKDDTQKGDTQKEDTQEDDTPGKEEDPVKVYSLTFVLDNGEPNIISFLKAGDPITYPENPIKTDYVFVKWDKEVEVMPSEDLIITALYSKIDYYSVPGCYTLEQIESRKGAPEISFEAATTDNNNNRTINIDENGLLTSTATSGETYKPVAFSSSVKESRKYIIKFPSSIKSLQRSIFESQTNILGIDLRLTSVTEIPVYCFRNNNDYGQSQSGGTYLNRAENKIERVYLPSTITKIQLTAFQSTVASTISIYIDLPQEEVTAFKSSFSPETKPQYKRLSWYYLDSNTSSYNLVS